MFTLFVLSLTLSLAFGQTDYCEKDLCSSGTTHIACNNTGGWSSTCPTTPAPYLINMNQALRQDTIDAHNVRRNRLALGNLPGFGPARRMATMRWSPQLASLAELNVKQCVRKRDECHNTDRFRNSGQNIALFAYEGAESSRTNQFLVRQAISNWWLESDFADMTVINNYPSSWSGGQINRFTLMAQQRNIAVGCAAARFFRNNNNQFLFTCYYAVNNVVGQPVYVTGRVGYGCQTGMNVAYPGLCKIDEDFNI
ncbi:antigen 5 like allergen Cul n 1 [Drosophila grimshawi]|uniref:Venom allergen-1 n=1 Tax=Drosophila grimshawi TaxID=7222 RepID=B4JSU8_DROGR|nr:antigen 5 like allergen Cul n 1 [Drosophila grimshawi]EDV94838.1 GH17451 [Drosophila grimshawi]